MRAIWAVGVVGLSLLVSAAHGAPPVAAPAEKVPAGPPRERRLHLSSAEASSYLVNDWNKFQENYLPLYVGDDDPKTAWTLKTEGIGEWLRVHVTPLAGATKVRLKVRNGYQKSDKLWAANSRAHGLTVVLLPSKTTVELDLEDKSGWQELAVEQPAGPVEAIELRVRSVYAGKKYDDLVLSDVQVFVTATTPDNPAFEKARLQKIVDWKKERLAAAKLFQTELGKALPVAAQYLMGPEAPAPKAAEAARQDCRDSLCSVLLQLASLRRGQDAKAAPGLSKAHELARAGFAGMTPVRVSTQDKRPMPEIDGACAPALAGCFEDPCYERLPLPRQMGYLKAQSIVTTEHTDLPPLADVLALKPAACKRAAHTIYGWVAREAAAADGTPGQIRTLLLVECGSVEGREGSYPAAGVQLLSYGADGLLDTLAGPSYGATLTWTREGGEPKLARGLAVDGDATRAFTAATAVAAAGK